MTNQNNSRPLVLILDDAEKQLVQFINALIQEQGLSCYLLEPMFSKVYNQISANARNEVAQMRQAEVENAQPQENVDKID